MHYYDYKNARMKELMAFVGILNTEQGTRYLRLNGTALEKMEIIGREANAGQRVPSVLPILS